MKPNWVIYQRDFKIGEAITWYKALDVLVKQEELTSYEVTHNLPEYITITVKGNYYKIIRER